MQVRILPLSLKKKVFVKCYMSSKQKHKRSTAEREEDLVLVADLYVKNMTYREIAQEINKSRHYNITFQTVSNDIKLLLDRWRETHDQKIDLYMIEQLKKLDKVEKEYWDAWERSKEEFRKVATKGKGVAGKDKPQYQEKSITTEERNGNPAYLAGVRQIIKDRCELLGMLKQKVEHSGSVQTTTEPRRVLKIERKNGC